ncbi:MAG: glycine cleavage system protein GcvH [Candidatus Firestonebacteria bacterium]
MCPKELKYTKSHKWIKIEGSNAIIGLTDFAIVQVGEIIFIRLPVKEDKITFDKSFGEFESTKAVFELFSPVTGTVLEINEEVVKSPEIITKDPYGKGWLVKAKLENPTEVSLLLNSDEYTAFTTGGQ